MKTDTWNLKRTADNSVFLLSKSIKLIFGEIQTILKTLDYVQHRYCNKLQYPVKIKNPNAKLAKVIISQLGGPDGELAASLRYLNQRYVMPYGEVKGLLTDIGVSVSVYDILMLDSKINTIVFYNISRIIIEKHRIM